MVQMLVLVVKCPKCKGQIKVPFFREPKNKSKIKVMTPHKCEVDWEDLIKKEAEKGRPNIKKA